MPLGYLLGFFQLTLQIGNTPLGIGADDQFFDVGSQLGFLSLEAGILDLPTGDTMTVPAAVSVIVAVNKARAFQLGSRRSELTFGVQ